MLEAEIARVARLNPGVDDADAGAVAMEEKRPIGARWRAGFASANLPP